MKLISRILLSLSPIALLGIASAANAADFTFNVPVNLQNMHREVNTIGVTCRTFKVRGNYTGPNVVGGGHTSYVAIPLDSNGGYRGTIVVNFDAESGKSASDATYYECDLYINGGSVQSHTSSTGAAFESRAGTARTIRVSGNISR